MIFIMQAIILAAGMGKRLGEYTKNNTKCMVRVNGIPLVDRVMKQLSVLSLNKVIIVIGYEGQKLMKYLGHERNGLHIEYIENPVYDKTNNIYSLALAKEKLREDDTLLIESDLIFDDGVLELLIKNPYPNLALVAKYESWMDGTMVRIDSDNNIVNFVPKAAFSYNEVSSYYKTVNIYKFSKDFLCNKYIPFLDAYTRAVGNNEYYENVLRIISFLNNQDLKALSITNEKWYEIDDKQDLDIAETLFAADDEILNKYYKRHGGFWRFPKMLDFYNVVNPFFIESRIIDEMEAFFRTLIAEYPSGIKVNSLIASKCWGVKDDYIVPGNGSAELIKVLMEKLSGSLGVIRPTYEEYTNRKEGGIVNFFPKNKYFRYNVKDLMVFFAVHHVDNLLLINPDNPSGNFIPIGDLKLLAAWCQSKNIRLIVDESFVDFSNDHDNNSLLNNGILETFPTLIVVKSISKSSGISGIRLGILCSSETHLIADIKKTVSLWNVNPFAEFFMQIFNKYETDYKSACNKLVTERGDFEYKLKNITFLRVMPSQSNYLLCEILPPLTSKQLVLLMLKRHNILIKDCSDKQGFEGRQFIRIAVRKHDDNVKLIHAFKGIEEDMKSKTHC